MDAQASILSVLLQLGWTTAKTEGIYLVAGSFTERGSHIPIVERSGFLV